MNDLEDLELHIIEENGKYGYADEAGNNVIPCIWTDASSFSEGLAYVADDQDNYGYIDKTGNVVIPFIYLDAGFFEDGLAPVRSNKGYGYIDKNNNVVIPFNSNWYDAEEFEDGIAKVYDCNYNVSYIDKFGNVIKN